MKLDGREAAAFCRAPDPGLAGALLHGAEEGLTASRRRELSDALLGPDADPVSLVRLEPAAVRREPATLDIALRSRGFFGGRPVVVVEGATDSLAEPLGAVLDELSPEDGFLIATAGSLPGRSALRRLFEGGKRLISLHILAGSPDPKEIEGTLRRLGVSSLDDAARAALMDLASGMDRACFERLLEVVALGWLGSSKPLDAEAVAALAPGAREADIDAFVEAVAEGRAEMIGPLLRRVAGAGATPVSVLLGLQRHFRQLTLVASGEGGPERTVERLRPPVWGARRDAVLRHLRAWRRDRLEIAVRLLYETDGRVRSVERAPAMALVERCALRLAMMAGR